MKRIVTLALLSLSLSSCSEYFDKQHSKNELKKKYSFALNYYVERLSETGNAMAKISYCPLFESYRDSINKYTRLSNELDY
jgi:hypothetical protein